ncbi:MAG: acyl-CoA dehydrogenase family protein [Deltaproteobacteria bacterium]|nr:acyl-CoA dehydrogenase family protein [Deltaproteobacteria bacterium]
MRRQIDTYIESLIEPERFEFYRNLCSFSDREIVPKLLSWERERCLIDDAAIKAMADFGLFGLTVEESFGGAGGQMLDLILMGFALGYHSHSVAITPGAAVSLGIKPLQLAGTKKQKAAHLYDLATGKRMFIFGLSEPGRGSDAANPQVTAKRINNGWCINGEKCWITNAKWASHTIVHALTNPDGRRAHRSTCFIVPMNHPNICYREIEGKQAWRQSSTGSIFFDNVEVSEDAMLGELNEGFKVMVSTLNGGRLFISALALASLAYALDATRRYAQERTQFNNRLIGRFQRVQDVLIDMDIALEQGVIWLINAVKQYDAGIMCRETAAKLKIECSQRASVLLPAAMEICGGMGCIDEFGLARHRDDLFVARVGEGSNFALRDLVVRPLIPEVPHFEQ